MLDLKQARAIKIPSIGQPVFIITKNGSYKPAVVKAERKNSGEVKFDENRAVNLVTFAGGLLDDVIKGGTHKMTPMDARQVDDFFNLSDRQFDVTPEALIFYQKWRKNKDFLARTNVFFYMPFIANLRHLDGCIHDQQSMQEFAEYFSNNPKKLAQLGKVMAIDFFIGNEDRINSNGEIVNAANIFFRKRRTKEVKFEILGVDYFDTSYHLKRHNLGRKMDRFWRIVGDPNRQAKIAINVVKNLNEKIAEGLGSDLDKKYRIKEESIAHIKAGFQIGLLEAAKFSKNYSGEKEEYIIPRANLALEALKDHQK